ncbi:MAG: hypothetical protein ABIG85_03815 [Chloroflexota bacterium]
MRLSEWYAWAPAREATSPKVLAVVEPVPAALGAERDPPCWVTWGDEPAARWGLLAPTAAGLVSLVIRVNIPQEGPRASAKLIRWSRVQVGDFAVEMQGEHRFISTSLEGIVLRGMDEEADRIVAFLQGVFAALAGRPLPDDPSSVQARREPRAG